MVTKLALRTCKSATDLSVRFFIGLFTCEKEFMMVKKFSLLSPFKEAAIAQVMISSAVILSSIICPSRDFFCIFEELD
ncbi:hypothetical protein Xentx_01426 [Xenorhabdus thuongxuanensis]|uniref:Uncharacterized protein n=1 Tax=Xenorhabdus thuongxuanensis TaxID=1873484 RepID=A0A1Q5U3W4_9GAMM|nr:hypothetical protein Xentx_01426 [Xenorhabdus thuongxuanensis]